MASCAGSVYLAESRADRLGRVSCGKSCIRFPSLDRVDRVDRDELTALLQDAVAATEPAPTPTPRADQPAAGPGDRRVPRR
jgi:hypothetical protein